MKKTVWATGLFAAFVATGALCNADDGLSDNHVYANSTMTAVVEKAQNGYLLDQKDLVDQPLELKVNEDLQSRYIYECIYHNRALKDNGETTRKVMVVGSESCGFSDTAENPVEKVSRIKEYVTTPQTSSDLHYYLTQMGVTGGNKAVPDLEDPEFTVCYQLYSDGEERRRKVSDYVAVVDDIYGDQGVVPLSADAQYNARKLLSEKLASTATFVEQDYKGKTCNLAVIAEDEYGAHSGACRRCTMMLVQPIMSVVGVTLRAGWTVIGSGGRSFLGFAVPAATTLAVETMTPVRAVAGKVYDVATYPLTQWRSVEIRVMDISLAILSGVFVFNRYFR